MIKEIELYCVFEKSNSDERLIDAFRKKEDAEKRLIKEDSEYLAWLQSHDKGLNDRWCKNLHYEYYMKKSPVQIYVDEEPEKHPTIAEKIAALLLYCGYDDIPYLFKDMDFKYISQAYVYLQSDELPIDSNTLITSALNMIAYEVFGSWDYIDVDANNSATRVKLIKNTSKKKIKEFEEKSGFPMY